MSNDGAVDRIDHYEKDSNIYFTRMHCGHEAKMTEKKMSKNVSKTTKITASQKTSMCFLKRFPTEMHSS